MQSVQPEMVQQPVFLDMDGSIDDLLSLITLLTLQNYRLTGVSVTSGNCYSENASESILRIFNLFEINDIEISISDAKPLNPFPTQWREKSKLFNQLDIIKKLTPDITKISESEAADFLAQKILAEKGNTIIILTGPATNMAKAIEIYPELIEKIEKIYWMAGAFFENGNVISPDHDGSAEWNIFWDPISAQKLIKSGLKLVLFPLDVCNQVPVDNYLMYLLKKQSKFKLSKLVSTVLGQLIVDHSNYAMWDVVPSIVLGFPDTVRISNTSIDVEIRGTSKGNIFKTSKGSPIYFASCIDDEKFYTDFANLMKTI